MKGIGTGNLLKHEIALNLLFIYLLYLAQMTIFPLNTGMHFERNVSLIPFKTIMEFVPILLKYGLMTGLENPHFNAGVINIIGNIVVFIPVGVMIPLAGKEVKGFKAAVLFGFITSFTIEILQFLFAEGRRMDIDDLILNTLGAAIGWGIFKVTKSLITRYKESVRN